MDPFTLTVYDHLPNGFLDTTVEELHRIVPTPSLIHLPGRSAPPLFVSILQHGNEPTGFLAIQALLRDYRSRDLPRALSFFVGNVTAARYRQRHLENQPDFNRIWLPGAGPEYEMTRRVVDEMRDRSVFASIDIHNNTGLNPHYACVNRLDHRFFQLATLFGRTVVYFTRPKGVQSAAFARLCPSVTLECGLPGQAQGVEHAREYVDACLHLREISTHRVAPHDIDLFHTVATVKIPNRYSFGFGGGSAADIRLSDDLDHMNFCELPPKTIIGWTRPGSGARLEVWDEGGREVETRYFTHVDGTIFTATSVMPSMLSLDAQVIRQDCLCYLMERLPCESLQDGHLGT